jgi:hypothetical protein
MRQLLVAMTLTTSLLTSGANLGTFERLWNLLSPLWGGYAGCIMDPYGQCRPASRIDEGCIMDPSGRCQPSSQIDAGCIMDPNGQCRPAGS